MQWNVSADNFGVLRVIFVDEVFILGGGDRLIGPRDIPRFPKR